MCAENLFAFLFFFLFAHNLLSAVSGVAGTRADSVWQGLSPEEEAVEVRENGGNRKP